MIDFRWLRIHMGDNDGTHPSAILDSHQGYMRVLQFREQEGDRWSEWKDIPIVDAPKSF